MNGQNTATLLLGGNFTIRINRNAANPTGVNMKKDFFH
jgi:hypothetical protein